MNSREQLIHIMNKAIQRVNPEEIIKSSLFLKDSLLEIQNGEYTITIDLSKYKTIYVIGTGKATAPMARAIEELLGSRITKGIIVVKYGHTCDLKRIEMIEAGHPVPDQNGVEAAKKIFDLAESANEQTLCITLISGGGSALLTLPYFSDDYTISLSDMQKTTELLLKSGADIHEVNCVRKHLSSIKGGRLAESIFPGAALTLMLSDVVGDSMDSIASGPTVPDSTTYADVDSILRRYKLKDAIPKEVNKVIQAGLKEKIKDTPKSGNPVFSAVTNVVIGSNALAVAEARETAGSLGFNTLVLTSQLTGEAREAAKFFSAIAKDINKSQLLIDKPAIILAGGETTVTIRGKGKGGRNQEMALAFLKEIENTPDYFSGVLFLSSATDGNDGPTDAAGGFASLVELKKVHSKNLSIEGYLEENNSFEILEKIDALHKTGPTNTNVCDIQLLLVE